MTKEQIKREIREEFMYRAKQGRIHYSMEEVIYIVNELLDEIEWEKQARENGSIV